MGGVSSLIGAVEDIDDLAESIIAPNPNRPLSFAVSQGMQPICRGIGRMPPALRSAFGPAGGGLSPLITVCQPYNDSQGISPPVYTPPAQGGQCVGVLYDITGTATATLANGNVSTNPVNSQGVGPLSIDQDAPPGTVGEFVRDSNGDTVASVFIAAPEGDVRLDVTFSRVDGLPDNCGDMPSQWRPGANPGPAADILPPGFDPRNPLPRIPNPNVPGAFIDLPPLDDGLIPSANPSGGPGSPNPGGAPVAGGGGNGDGEDVDFGDPPDGQNWVGAQIELTVPPARGNIAGTGPGNIAYAQVVGNAHLRYAGNLRGTNEPLRSQFAILGRPLSSLRLIGCRVQTLPGVSWIVRPIASPDCQVTECESTI